MRVRDGGTGAQPAPDPALPPHLEHGAVLEDVLLVTHHAVLIERRDPLLRVLHDLRGRTEGVSPATDTELGGMLQEAGRGSAGCGTERRILWASG